MSRAVSVPDPEIVASLPEGLADRRALLNALVTNLDPHERLIVAAAAESPEIGLVALTDSRLVFMYRAGRIRPRTMLASFARSDLRGCRWNESSVLVLRYALAPLRFANVEPREAISLIADELEEPPTDRWTAAADTEPAQALIRGLSARVPPGERVIVIAESFSGYQGVVALTDRTLLWSSYAQDGQLGYASWQRDVFRAAQLDPDGFRLLQEDEKFLVFTKVSPAEAAHDIVRSFARSTAASTADLPEVCIPSQTPHRVRLGLELVEQSKLDRFNGDYTAALEALSLNRPLAALKHLRAVISCDADDEYPSAKLLALCASSQLGDARSVAVLFDMCRDDQPPDPIVRFNVVDSSLELYLQDTAKIAITLRPALSLPHQARILARVGFLLGAKRLTEAVDELEHVSPSVFCTGRDETLCALLVDTSQWDRLLQVSSDSPYDGAYIYKAAALAAKGLTDAALVVYDDAIRGFAADQRRHIARYAKAQLLLKTGDLGRARRELARLYADDPSFNDYAGLLELVKPSGTVRSGREPIPEEIRHAVWRRDEGRCVQCGSQAQLEFDHVIPFSRGGSNTERNLQLLCEPCNRAKSATI